MSNSAMKMSGGGLQVGKDLGEGSSVCCPPWARARAFGLNIYKIGSKRELE